MVVKYVRTPIGVFPSLRTAADAHSLNYHALHVRLVRKPLDYFYCDAMGNSLHIKLTPKPGEGGSSRRIQRSVGTPTGVYASIRDAAVNMGLTYHQVYVRVKRGDAGYYLAQA